MARGMYAQGYDFGHFLGMSMCPLTIEVIVRVAYFTKALSEGKEFSEALPIAGQTKLRTMLFAAHSVAAMANAGKIAITNSRTA